MAILMVTIRLSTKRPSVIFLFSINSTSRGATLEKFVQDGGSTHTPQPWGVFTQPCSQLFTQAKSQLELTVECISSSSESSSVCAIIATCALRGWRGTESIDAQCCPFTTLLSCRLPDLSPSFPSSPSLSGARSLPPLWSTLRLLLSVSENTKTFHASTQQHVRRSPPLPSPLCPLRSHSPRSIPPALLSLLFNP
ncbi:hypothetical protein QOT17_024813 [Balamuthia mandrillaris]